MRINIGRRPAALVAIGALGLSGAGAALAAGPGIPQGQFMGPATKGGDTQGNIAFEVTKQQSKRFVASVTIGANASCSGGETQPITFGGLRGRVAIKNNGTFEAERKYDSSFSEEPGEISIEGKFVSDDRARGSFRVTDSRAGGITCRTGKLDFRANRGEDGGPQ